MYIMKLIIMDFIQLISIILLHYCLIKIQHKKLIQIQYTLLYLQDNIINNYIIRNNIITNY